MEWKNININVQNIETDTGRSTLIRMPHKSEYDGFAFWHPSKLVRSGKNSYAVSVGYTNEFKFTLKKYGKGKWNKFDVIEEKEITAEEFEKAFGVMDKNITAPVQKNEFETYKPENKEAVKDNLKEELKDD